MRVATVRFAVVGVLLLLPATSAAQDLPAPAPGSAPASGPAPASGSAPASGPAHASGSAPASGPAPASGSAPSPAAPSTGVESSPLPPPVAGTAVETTGENLTGVPNPTAAPASGDDWHFFTHGYFRAPLRVGVGKRPAC